MKVPPQDRWSMSPLPCLCSYPGPYCYPISPNLICSVGSAECWDEPGRERKRTPAARCCSKDHRKQEAREEDASSLSEWVTWVGQLKETALGSPSAESALSFPGSLNQGVQTQASLLPSHLVERDLSFSHLDNLTSSNQTNRLSSPLSQKDIVKGSWLERVRFWVCSPDTY